MTIELWVGGAEALAYRRRVEDASRAAKVGRRDVGGGVSRSR